LQEHLRPSAAQDEIFALVKEGGGIQVEDRAVGFGSAAPHDDQHS
jgi:hypothetical protein